MSAGPLKIAWFWPSRAENVFYSTEKAMRSEILLCFWLCKGIFSCNPKIKLSYNSLCRLKPVEFYFKTVIVSENSVENSSTI